MGQSILGNLYSQQSEEKKRTKILRPDRVKFPYHVLPGPIRELIDAAEEFGGFSREYCVGAALSVFSAAGGASFAIKVKSSWIQNPCIWMCVIGDAASKKTPAMKVFMKPIWDLEKEFDLMYKDELVDYNEAVERGEKRDHPVRRELIVESFTMEGLNKVLSVNPNGVLMFNDELAGFIKSMDMYRSGGNDKEKWLSIYDSGDIKISRASKETVLISNPFVSMLGGIQPAVLDELAGGAREGDGFTYRFNFMIPENVGGEVWMDEEIPDELLRRYAGGVKRVVMEKPYRGRYMVMSPGAKKRFAEWYNSIHGNIDLIPEELSMQRSLYSKFISHCLRLAGTIEAMRWGFGMSDGMELSEEAMIAGIEMMTYFIWSSCMAHNMIKDIPDRIIMAGEMFREGISLTEIGRKMGVSKMAVSKWKKKNPELFALED